MASEKKTLFVHLEKKALHTELTNRASCTTRPLIPGSSTQTCILGVRGFLSIQTYELSYNGDVFITQDILYKKTNLNDLCLLLNVSKLLVLSVNYYYYYQ